MVAEEMCESNDKGWDFKEVPLKKSCVDCGTSKTPLWRGGPAGPKSLCNACGIKSRKKRNALLGLTKPNEKKKTKDTMNNNNVNGSNNSSSCCSSSNCYSDSSSNDKLMAMWDILKPQNVRMEESNEELQAAVLLMALSQGLNYC